ncbi:hypothetical protein [Hyalangium versicolor]|uniref:hypothetical protein n=1 Tax=Hyalangium versicolor TaxID=2861190 RepID=UPI001CCE24A9|nr:hypothetical protein [Hyalangium versicolor]
MGWSGTSRKWMQVSSGLLLGAFVACAPPEPTPPGGQGPSAGIAAMEPAPQMEVASYDATLQVPRCSASGLGCDSEALFDGRGPLGPEPHAPNTLGGTCLDGSAGTYHSDESVDRIRLYTTDGSALAPGKEITIEVSFWAYSIGNRVDLYAAEDASNPTWTLFQVLTPQGRGANTLTATYTLPEGITGVQAVRAAIRYTGASSSCDGEGYNDRDDLAFQVGASTGCSETMNP